jgi:antitoxin (DNA-binding transcriptional repressor) of toxin-antitoxin stability system
MKKINATKFKEQCLALLENIGAEGLLITKHGRPIAKLIPVETAPSKLIGALRGKIKVKGDILSTGMKWHAES